MKHLKLNDEAALSFLKEEDYTECNAVTLKGKYAAFAKKLQVAVVSEKSEDALSAIATLDKTLNDYIALVPPAVVDLVRAREKQLAGFAAPEVAPAPARPAVMPAGSSLL